jgi:lipopolysaccharide transport system permease protein
MGMRGDDDWTGDVQFSESFRPSRLVEQMEARMGIPRLQPRTESELPSAPPPKERYRPSIPLALRQLARARELIRTFVERDLRVRYRQAVLGAAWALAQPLLLMVVFSFAFGRVAGVGSEGAPYPIFVYSALVPWGVLTGSVGYGISNIVGNAPIVRKIYLPRDVIPVASALSAGVDFLASGVILLGMLLVYGYGPSVTWFAYPLLFLVLCEFALAATFVSTLITVYFRDTRFAIPTLLQAMLFATPVAYPLSRILRTLPPSLRKPYLYLNPFAPLLDGFRRVLLHGRWPLWGPVGAAALTGSVSLVLSYWWYKRIDSRFADVI